MNGEFLAPVRRLSFFLWQDTFDQLRPQALALFRAALLWTLSAPEFRIGHTVRRYLAVVLALGIPGISAKAAPPRTASSPFCRSSRQSAGSANPKPATDNGADEGNCGGDRQPCARHSAVARHVDQVGSNHRG